MLAEDCQRISPGGNHELFQSTEVTRHHRKLQARSRWQVLPDDSSGPRRPQIDCMEVHLKYEKFIRDRIRKEYRTADDGFHRGVQPLLVQGDKSTEGSQHRGRLVQGFEICPRWPRESTEPNGFVFEIQVSEVQEEAHHQSTPVGDVTPDCAWHQLHPVRSRENQISKTAIRSWVGTGPRGFDSEVSANRLVAK